MEIGYMDIDPLRGKHMCAGLRSAGFGVMCINAYEFPEQDLTAIDADLLVVNLAERDVGKDASISNILIHFGSVPKVVIADDASLKTSFLDDITNLVVLLPAPVNAECLSRKIGSLQIDLGQQNCLQRLRLGHVTLDQTSGEATVDGSVVKMTPKDYQVASCLMSNIGKTLSRPYLLREVWGIEVALNTRTVDVHVSRVRKALQLVPERGYSVTTVYQYGYRLDQVD